MSSPSSSNTPAISVSEKLQQARDQLLNTRRAVYLASEKAEQLTWRTFQPEGGKRVKCVVLPGAPAERQDEPIDTTLAVIARVSDKDTFLVPDGNWRGDQRSYTRALVDLKLWVALEAVSENQMLRNDFEASRAVIERLRNECRTEVGYYSSGVLVKGKEEQDKHVDKIKLRHCVFADRDWDDNDEETAIGIDPNDPRKAEYTLRGYPLRHSKAKEERKAIISGKQHKLNVIGAYDVNEKRIPPSRVAEELRGAIVKAYFTLSHTPIQSESKDSFSADLASVTVVVPPTPRRPPSTPSRQATKRKGPEDPFADSDDESTVKEEVLEDPFATTSGESPTKKQKVNFTFVPPNRGRRQ